MIELLRAALADRYRIERELGQGGMATVYLAHDLRHDRPVALKLLREDVAQLLGAERFLQEIRTTGRLQHPHILPLLDSGEAAGRLFYVMPLRIRRNPSRPPDPRRQPPRCGGNPPRSAIAAALDVAHRQGVIHRDLKPENVLLSDGLPLIADFGIALALNQAKGDRLTETGTSLGTPAYMSPEQIAGTRALDGRSDLYSLGCLAFELLTGRPPYQGATSFATMAAHVSEPIPPVTSPRSRSPLGLAAAVQRALAKDPADRFATVAEFADGAQCQHERARSGPGSRRRHRSWCSRSRT